jgi:ribonuclease Y
MEVCFLTMPWILWVIIGLIIGGGAVGMFFYTREKNAEKNIADAEEQAKQIINDAIKNAESKKREALVEAKEEIHKNRSEYEREVK